MRRRLPRALSAATALALIAAVGASSPAAAAPAKAARKAPAKAKRYHFKLAAVTAKPEVAADTAQQATPRVQAQITKAFGGGHPQLVALAGAPDPDASAPAYRAFLKKQRVAGAYLVTVEITDATLEVVPMDTRPGAQRVVAQVGVHLLGEIIPDRTIGFTGEGEATVKIEVGKTVRDRDREYAWDQAAEAAIADALATVFAQLGRPPAKK